jgi:hypothetical protein
MVQRFATLPSCLYEDLHLLFHPLLTNIFTQFLGA